MDKFWQWMEEKTGFNEFHFKNHTREGFKQMLIGYMIQYLIEKNKDKLLTIVTYKYKDIDEYYDFIKECVESV